MSKRPSSEAGPSSGQDTSKRSRPDLSPPRPQSLHAWLHPDLPPPLMTNSPPLHDSTSTFLSFSISFMPPAHITSEAALAKEARRMVRDLNVVSHVSEAVTEAGDGAFQDGEGMVTSNKGKQRAREPDHRMWAIRTLCLKEGRDGTKGDDDYQLLETYNDDGEKFGGERVLRILKDERGVDVLTVCCRWYGGDMLGPIRFQHIGLTAKTSLNALQKLSTLRDLRQGLEALDDEIQSLRDTINPPGSPILSVDPKQTGKGGSEGKYNEIDDILRLERLVKAKENTKKALEGKVGWAAMERARVEEDTGAAR